jgi:hypothetical protein
MQLLNPRLAIAASSNQTSQKTEEGCFLSSTKKADCNACSCRLGVVGFLWATADLQVASWVIWNILGAAHGIQITSTAAKKSRNRSQPKTINARTTPRRCNRCYRRRWSTERCNNLERFACLLVLLLSFFLSWDVQSHLPVDMGARFLPLLLLRYLTMRQFNVIWTDMSKLLL